jgi:hypothetical protein
MADGKAGLAALGSKMDSRRVDDVTYWFAAGSLEWPRRPRQPERPLAHLLPIYDEALNAYRDRGPVVTALKPPGQQVVPPGFNHHVLLDGLLAGRWKRTLTTDAVAVTIALFHRPSKAVIRALEHAADRYGSFMQLRVRLTVGSVESG